MANDQTPSGDDRFVRIQRLVLEYLAKDDATSEMDLLADHQDLMPELAEQLRIGRLIKQATGSGLEATADYEASEDIYSVIEDGQNFGPYEIVGMLGKGGMGAVYEAIEIVDGRRVALKVLHHKLQSPKDRQRFLQEGRIAASVVHPNIVYVFGSAEIDGMPAIAMELAPRGTLQDRVKESGPLPVAEAVDLVLQAIDGLEAAQTGGVLHRDIKPANCFLDSDGTVKIGDFGLSISTESRGEANLTQSGVFLGTPAYCSPEQLRGNELDVRSDIYSVGVTLFYLLTGNLPFKTDRMVELVASVIDRPAPSPRALQPRVPTGLANVVGRCLAKKSAQRFQNYHQLRQALLPYRSEAPAHGTLGYRTLAYCIDIIILAIPFGIFEFVELEVLVTDWLMVATTTAYFTVLEGIWRASAGKAICRLRVVGRNREAPGILRAMLRVVLVATADLSATWIVQSAGANVFAPLSLLLFVTARKDNGYAGIHDLASGTRVIGVASTQSRPNSPLACQGMAVETHNEVRIGPYDVVVSLDSFGDFEIVLGRDPRLLRDVWIRQCPGGATPIPPKLRDLSRVGRLRWLNGQRGTDGGWDAYEAPTGSPLLNLVSTRPSWHAVRFWLLDLSYELNASRQDETLPTVLDLDRVWITADGRAKLLDFQPPGLQRLLQDPEFDSDCSPTQNINVFCKRVALSALEGQVLPEESIAGREVRCPMPLTARAVVNSLTEREDGNLPIDELVALTQTSPVVSTHQRVLIFAICWLLPVLLSLGGAVSTDITLLDHPAIEGYMDRREELTAFAAFWIAYGICFVVMPSLCSTILFGESLLLKCMGIVIVDSNGDRAPRRHVLLRNTILWLACLCPVGMLIAALWWERPAYQIIVCVSIIFLAAYWSFSLSALLRTDIAEFIFGRRLFLARDARVTCRSSMRLLLTRASQSVRAWLSPGALFEHSSVGKPPRSDRCLRRFELLAILS